MGASEGTPAAEELLRHAGWLRRLAARLASDAGEAEDLVQETWLAALRHPPRAGALRPWLARVLSNAAKKRRRGELRRAEREAARAAEEREPAPDPAETAAELEAQRALLEAVLALPEPERTIVTLRWFHELDSPTIGARFGMPAATVRWRLARAMGELRTRLDERHGGSREAWATLLAPVSLGTAKGAATALQGALAMSGLAKLGVAAAAVALAGWAWLGWERSEQRSAEQIGPIDVEAAADEREGTSAADPPERTTGAPSAQPQRLALESEAEREALPTDEPNAALPPASVTAVVVDAEGNRLARATLSTWKGLVPRVAESGPDGALELALPPGPARGWTQELALRCAGFAERRLEAVVAPGEVTALGELTLEPGGAVRGRVVDETGIAVEGARVRPLPAELPRGDERYRRLHGFGAPPVPETTSGVDGAFVLDGLPAGPTRLWAKAEHTRHGWSEPVEVVAGEVLEDALIVAERWRREDLIHGRVVDPEGRPVPDARVVSSAVQGGSSSGGSNTTDDEGRFELVVLFDAPHELTAEDPEGRWGATGARGVQPGTRDLVLRLPEKRELVVRVLDEDGAPLERYSYAVMLANRGSSFHPGDLHHPEGTVRIAPLGLPFSLRIQAEGYRLAEQGPLDPDSLPDEVVFELEPLPAIAGVVTAGGEPVSGASVTLLRAHPDFDARVNGFVSRCTPAGGQASSGELGRFRMLVDEEGDFLVRASAEGWGAAELGPLRLRFGALPDDLALELPPAGVLEGVVLLPDGKDPTGAIVGANRGDGAPRTQRVGADGSFRFEGLTPGSYELSRRDAELDPGSSSYSAGWPPQPFEPTCEVYSGSTTRCDLDLRDG